MKTALEDDEDWIADEAEDDTPVAKSAGSVERLLWEDFLQSKKAIEDAKRREKEKMLEKRKRCKRKRQPAEPPKPAKRVVVPEGGGGTHVRDVYDRWFDELNTQD